MRTSTWSRNGTSSSRRDPFPVSMKALTKTAAVSETREPAAGRWRLSERGWACLQATPLTVVLAVFLVVPILTILVVSFWDYDEYRLLPGFVLTNYADVLGSEVTWKTYLETLKLAVLTWVLTATIG